MLSKATGSTFAARLLSVGALSTLIVSCAVADVTVYVSPTGKDTNNGKTATQAFATLTKARDMANYYRNNNIAVGATIFLAGGTYSFPSPFYLAANQSNMTFKPLSDNDPVRFIGGVALKASAKLTDAKLLAKIPAAARNSIITFSLAALSVDGGTMKRRSANEYYTITSGMQLFLDGKPGTLARYPANGWMKVEPGTNVAQYSTAFKSSDAHVLALAGSTDVWAHGYFANLWSDSWHPISTINASTKAVTLSGQGPYYGFDPIGRWRVENDVTSLDQPGEYYIDRTNNRVLLYPISTTKEVLASTTEKPLIQLSGANNITFEGISFEVGRQSGLVIVNGNDNLVDNCSFRNFGQNGVEINGGFRNGVRATAFNTVGEMGVVLSGGDRVSLTPGNNFVEDSTFANWAQDIHSYRPAVRILGVGNRVSRNTMTDSTGQAVMINGNNHVIEGNEVARVLTEVGDSGAIYIGYNVTERGNIIRNNLLHDIFTPSGYAEWYWDNYPIYLDDLSSGTTVSGNIMTNCTCGIILGGGRNNTLTKNVFNSVPHPIEADARGKTFKADYFAKGGRFFQNTAEVNAFGSIYTAAYPELKTLLSEDYTMPANNEISNSTAQTTWIKNWDNYVANGYTLRANLLGYDPRFMSPATYDFRLQPSSPARTLGLTPITKDTIGCQFVPTAITANIASLKP